MEELAHVLVEKIKETYKSHNIYSYKYVTIFYDTKKDKNVEKYSYECRIYGPEKYVGFINLGGTNDGKPLTATKQGINQAKQFIDTVISYKDFDKKSGNTLGTGIAYREQYNNKKLIKYV